MEGPKDETRPVEMLVRLSVEALERLGHALEVAHFANVRGRQRLALDETNHHEPRLAIDDLRRNAHLGRRPHGEKLVGADGADMGLVLADLDDELLAAILDREVDVAQAPAQAPPPGGAQASSPSSGAADRRLGGSHSRTPGIASPCPG